MVHSPHEIIYLLHFNDFAYHPRPLHQKGPEDKIGLILPLSKNSLTEQDGKFGWVKWLHRWNWNDPWQHTIKIGWGIIWNYNMIWITL